jgi:GNAT superfamily N-acetyltransferase
MPAPQWALMEESSVSSRAGAILRSYKSAMAVEFYYFTPTSTDTQEEPKNEQEVAPCRTVLAGVLLAAPVIGLVSLDVMPDFRRSGIGEHLLRAYIEHVRTTTTLQHVTLTTEPDNVAALALYSKLGFCTHAGDPDSLIGSVVCRLELVRVGEGGLSHPSPPISSISSACNRATGQ